MKHLLLTSAAALAAFAAPALHAQETGRVISSVPMIQQVAVPRQVCTQQPVAVEQPKSGAGAVLGAVAGGAAGNAIGDGGGRALATIVGVVGGALLGNRIEGSSTQMQQQTQCTTQTFYENRAMGYNVTYEFAGKQYTVQMPQDPGPTVRLQVTAIGASSAPVMSPQPQYAPQYGPSYSPQYSPQYAPPPYTPQYAPQYTPQSMVSPVITSPVYVAYPAPVYRPRYYTPNVSLSLGYVWGGHRHRH